MEPFVLHVDVDEFIAAVEVLRRPELRGKPVVVGGAGRPVARAVVATASYEARRYGVTSGMPLAAAARRCPDAVFLALDRPAYEHASERVMKALGSVAGRLEPGGWDEAFLAVTTDEPLALARKVQRIVRERTSLSCSVGIGDNKLQAKLASGFAKPAGVFVLRDSNWREVMNDRPVSALWGVGRKRARRLEGLGMRTVGDLAGADEPVLARAFGPATGPWLRHTARGEHDSAVASQRRPPRSRGREKTFAQDVEDDERVRDEIAAMARSVAGDLRSSERALRVVVKLRFVPFATHTHGVSLAAPAADTDVIEAGAIAALGAFEIDRPVRLAGVRLELDS